MDSLPIDVLRYIVNFLSQDDKLTCLLVSKQFLAACLGRSFPRCSSLRIRVGQCPSHAGMTSSETCLTLCQCQEHGTLQLLQHLLPTLSDEIRTLLLEDELARGQISDASLHAMLTHCADAPLTRLELSRCDLSLVRPWTLSLLAQFTRLQELCLDGCLLPLSESQLIRTLSASFDTLTTLEMKDCGLVTDKLARSISRSCPLLELFSVSGCRSVSAFSALSLVESARLRRSPALTMHAENTGFDPRMLERYMLSPLFDGGRHWRLRPASLEIGYERQAVLVEHADAMCVLIYV